MKNYYLHANWKLKPLTHFELPKNLRRANVAIPAEIPGTVHTDLFNAKIIPDPFCADNELKLKWIHQNEWLYWTKFDLPDEITLDAPVYLIFEGLDTISEIYLNGNIIGRSENMFRSYRFQVKKYLKTKGNILMVSFESPTTYGQKLEKERGKLPVALNSERVYLRKAQYSFGWDWGPSFPTMGIWRPVYICQPAAAQIKNVRFWVEKLQRRKAEVYIQTKIEGNLNDGELEVRLWDGKEYLQSTVTQLQKKKLIVKMEVPEPHLWWPNGEGHPYLYTLQVVLKDHQKRELDSWEGKVGIRIIKLILNEKNKSVFKFYVNGRYVFIKGVNWIPSDSFLPRVNDSTYRSLLTLARDAHVNMIRVWGGGIYEDQRFYQICDELGLMVWQDFMFACGAYPENRSFIENVQGEVKQVVQKLQHHPCIALWCGNNENEWIWHQKNQQSIREMPGYKLFHKIIPQIIRETDPWRPYWPTTPFGNETDPNSEKSGNRHQWEIWSNWKDYREVKNDKSLFVTEFGFQAPANPSTWQQCLPEDSRHPQSYLFEFHNKQVEGNERLIRFLAAQLPLQSAWNDFIYLTQLNQGFALKTCIEHWRMRNPKTAGSIVWQLNDCWPVTSWSLIDYQRIPKLSYYFVKQANAPVLVMVHQENSELDVIIKNDTTSSVTGRLQILLFENESGDVWQEKNISIRVSERSHKFIEKIFRQQLKNSQGWIGVISLYDQENNLIHRNCYSSWPWKYHRLPKPELRLLKNKTADQLSWTLTASQLALFIDFYSPDFIFYPRGFILLPGEVQTIYGSPLKNRKRPPQQIQKFCLNHYLSQ